MNAAGRTFLAGLSGLLLGEEAAGRAGIPARNPGRRFIVAFELSGEKGFQFVWPHASLPRFPGKQVLMVVRSMPRARNEGGNGAVDLPARRHLRINGALRQPLHGNTARGEAEEFLVPLENGRLRLAFTPPAAMRIDPGRPSAVIRLYDAEGPK